jgi:hypothetical protein
MNLAHEMVVAAVAGSLKIVKRFVDEKDFEVIADKVLNGVEGHFKDDSLLDDIAETMCATIRDTLNVKDSDPDN